MMNEKVIYSTASEDFHYMDINVPCQAACPAFTDIPAYIRALYEERYHQSYDINRSVNIFPGVLGRICSRPCEDKCRHGEPELGRPVNICHIKRAASDYMNRNPEPLSKVLSPNGRTIAVVGSGPAGLAAGHDLAALGFSVTILEAMDRPGGMLRYGIPEFRLPRDILEAEIGHILDAGVTLKTGIRVGEDVSMEELAGAHDAVLLAAGCYDSNPLNVPGENKKGVYSGLRFMMDVCSGKAPSIGKRALIIGAGFTAFDCARSSLRLGAEEVAICLRRTEEDLTVTEDEVLETKKEGVKIHSLMISRQINGDGKVEGVGFVRSRPGALRPDGRHEVAPIEGSEFIMPADAVIVATGQRPLPIGTPAKKDRRGVVVADRDTYRSSTGSLYVAGDYLTGPSTVIEAIASGRRAAERIAGDLLGRPLREKVVRMEACEITDRPRVWDFLPRQEMPTIEPVENRFEAFNREVEKGLSREQAKEESQRCYLCYLHYEIDIGRCIYCRYCIDVAPRDCIKLVESVETGPDGAITGLVETSHWRKVNAVVIDNSRCIRCGECMRVCPVNCISVTRVELTERLKEIEHG